VSPIGIVVSSTLETTQYNIRILGSIECYEHNGTNHDGMDPPSSEKRTTSQETGSIYATVAKIAAMSAADLF